LLVGISFRSRLLRKSPQVATLRVHSRFPFASIRGLNYLSLASARFDAQVRIIRNKPKREDSADQVDDAGDDHAPLKTGDKCRRAGE
jgi:hypothetical protein